METPYLHRKYFSKKRQRDTAWENEAIRWEGFVEEGWGSTPSLLGRYNGIQDCSWDMGQWGFTLGRKTCVWVLAGGLKVRWIHIWEMTKACHTTGSLQAAVGPRTAITRGNKTESSTQRPKVSKRTSLNCSSFCKNERGRRNKAQNNKIHQGRTMGRARQPTNYSDL